MMLFLAPMASRAKASHASSFGERLDQRGRVVGRNVDSLPAKDGLRLLEVLLAGADQTPRGVVHFHEKLVNKMCLWRISKARDDIKLRSLDVHLNNHEVLGAVRGSGAAVRLHGSLAFMVRHYNSCGHYNSCVQPSGPSVLSAHGGSGEGS